MLSLLGILTINCGDDHYADSMVISGVTERDADRLIVATSRLWNVSDFPLEVCFQGAGDGTAAHEAAVREAVENAWSDRPRSVVAFNGWGTCADDDSSGDIRIYLDSSISISSAYIGTANRPPTRRVSLRTPLSSYFTNLTCAYIHEFGHALGIQHEQAHPDKPPTCDDTEDLYYDGAVLTSYDAQAVMNYCAGHPTGLTDKERLFTEMAYPDGQAIPIANSTALYLGDGLLARTDSRFFTSWTNRGATDAAFDDVSSINWKALGSGTSWTSVGAGLYLDSSVLDSGVQQLRAEFDDFRGESRMASAQVVLDDGYHAAVVMSIIML